MTSSEAPADRPWRNFHGRRHGKKLRPGQIEHLATTLERVAVPAVGWEENPERQPLDLAALWDTRRPVWLEIGFGSGEHLLHQARIHPEIDFIGCEPFLNGVATLLSKLEHGLERRIRVHAGDARDLLDVLPSGSIARCFLLYPDPWPKRKHHKRRFMSAENLAALSRVMMPGADLMLATDIPDYARHALEAVAAEPDLVWTAERPGDWREPWPGWYRTRYEAKAVREGRQPHYLRFRRTSTTM